MHEAGETDKLCQQLTTRVIPASCVERCFVCTTVAGCLLQDHCNPSTKGAFLGGGYGATIIRLLQEYLLQE